MINLTQGLYSRFTALTEGAHNAFWEAVQGQFFEDEAPEGTEYPYAVYRIITQTPDRTFSETFRDTLVQFDLYSSQSSSREVKQMVADCRALYDEQRFVIADNTLLKMAEVNVIPGRENVTTPEGTSKIWHYSMDFELKTEDQ